MLSTNKHLNLFEHYQQRGSLPIENNLTRGLAIVLKEYPLVLDRLIDFINSKLEQNYSLGKYSNLNDVTIEIQKNTADIAKNLNNIELVVGMTLTVELPKGSRVWNEKREGINIPDIIILIEGQIVIIEVKRTSEDARNQLKDQVNSLVEYFDDNEGIVTSTCIEAKWEDMINILESVNSILSGNAPILNHYIEHLGNHYPQWFPLKTFSELSITEENKAQIDKRLARLIQDASLERVNKVSDEVYTYIPIEEGFVSQARIDINYSLKEMEINFWLADTKKQGVELYKSIGETISWLKKNTIQVANLKLPLEISPYIRFAHFNSTIISYLLNKEEMINKFKYDTVKYYEYWKSISYRWKREDWDELFNRIFDENSLFLLDEPFKTDFQTNFRKSNRNQVDVVTGFKITVRVNEEQLRALDLEKNIDDKELVTFVNKIVDNTLKIIS